MLQPEGEVLSTTENGALWSGIPCKSLLAMAAERVAASSSSQASSDSALPGLPCSALVCHTAAHVQAFC